MNQDTHWYMNYDKSCQFKNRRDNYQNSSPAQWQRSFSSQSFRNNNGGGYRGSRSSHQPHYSYGQPMPRVTSVTTNPWPTILPANSPPVRPQEEPSTSQTPARVSMTEVLEEGIMKTTLVDASAEGGIVEPKMEEVTVKMEDVKPALPCVDLSEDDPETRLNKFHFETRTLYLQPLIGNTDECHFIEVLRKFKVVLSREKGEIKSLSDFVKLLTRYMMFFVSNYKRIGGGYEEEFLEVMEDVMVQYCDVVTMLIRFQVQQKKKRQTKRLASRVKTLLSRCLLFRMDSIMHCLFKLKLETLENELRIFWTDIFIFFLNKVKYDMQDDDRFRAFIAYQLFKTIRSKEEEKTIDNAMYGRLGCMRTLKAIPYLKDVMELKQNPRYVERDLLDRYWRWWKEERDFCSSLQQPSTIQIPGDTNREFTTLRRPVVATTQLDEVARLMQDRKSGKNPGLFEAFEKRDPLSESVLFDSRLSFSGCDDSDQENVNYESGDDVIEMTVLPRVVETVELTDSDDDDDDLIVIEPEKSSEKQPELEPQPTPTIQPQEKQPELEHLPTPTIEPLEKQPELEHQPTPTIEPLEKQPEPQPTQSIENDKPDIFSQLIEPEIPDTPMEVSVEVDNNPETEENLAEMNFLEFYDPDLEGFEENFDLLDDNIDEHAQTVDGKARYESIFDRPTFDEGSSDKPFDFDGSDEEDKEMEVPQPPAPSIDEPSVLVPEPEPEPTVEIPALEPIAESVPTVEPETVVEQPQPEAFVNLPEEPKDVAQVEPPQMVVETPQNEETIVGEPEIVEEPTTTVIEPPQIEETKTKETVEEIPTQTFAEFNQLEVVETNHPEPIEEPLIIEEPKKQAKTRRKPRKERKQKPKIPPTANDLYLDLWEADVETKEKKKKKKTQREGSRRSKRHVKSCVIDVAQNEAAQSVSSSEPPLVADDVYEKGVGSLPDNSPAYEALDVSDVQQYFYEKGIVAEYVDNFSKTLSPSDDMEQTPKDIPVATPPDFLLEHQQLVGSKALLSYAAVIPPMDKLDLSGSQPCTPQNSPSTNVYGLGTTNLVYPAEVRPPILVNRDQFVQNNNQPVKKHSVRFVEPEKKRKRRSDEQTQSSAKLPRLQPTYHVTAEEDLLSMDGPLGKPLRHPHDIYWDNRAVLDKAAPSKVDFDFCKKEVPNQAATLDWTTNKQLYIKLKKSDLVSSAIVQSYQQERMRKQEAEAEAFRIEKEKLAVHDRAWQRAKMMERREKEFKQGNQIFLCLFNDKEHRRVSFKVDEEPNHKNRRNGHVVTDNRNTNTADTATKTPRFSLPSSEKTNRFIGGINIPKKKVSFDNAIKLNGSASENGKLPSIRRPPSGRPNTTKGRPGRQKTTFAD